MLRGIILLFDVYAGCSSPESSDCPYGLKELISKESCFFLSADSSLSQYLMTLNVPLLKEDLTRLFFSYCEGEDSVPRRFWEIAK